MKTQITPLSSWPEAAPRLVAVAAGRAPADLVIRNGQWVNVHTREILPGHDIAIAEGRFAAIAPDLSYAIGPETRVIDAAGRYMIPGLCDGHMHVESGMVTVTEFVRAVVPHGTTSMFIDPHEIANVLGLPGVRVWRQNVGTVKLGDGRMSAGGWSDLAPVLVLKNAGCEGVVLVSLPSETGRIERMR